MWRGNSGRDAVCLHIAQGGYQSSIDYMRQAGTSAHFVISLTGAVAQCVDTDDSAWGNGLTPNGRGWLTPSGRPVAPSWSGIRAGVNPNRTTISIEHAGFSGAPLSAAQQTATVALLAWLATQHPTLAPYRPARTLIGHADINPRDKPFCPGPAFDVAALASRANGDAPPPVYTADSPILGPAHVTGAAALLRERATAYNAYDISVIVGAYAATCADVGVDPAIALAQMIHETGWLTSWWCERPRRNPAGIGVTGAWRPWRMPGPWAQRGALWLEGVSFSDWRRESVPAHVGRLLAYALTDEQATAAQRKLIDYALSVRPLPAAYRGVAPTLRGLNGRWAVPGTTYADAVARVATAITGA